MRPSQHRGSPATLQWCRNSGQREDVAEMMPGIRVLLMRKMAPILRTSMRLPVVGAPLVRGR